MGHIRLGTLPRSKKWREVVELLASDAPLDAVAAAAAQASERDLSRASDDPERERVEIDGVVELHKTAAARLLIALAKEWLKGAGGGLDPLDFPCIPAGQLAKVLNYQGEDMVRQAVKRTRKDLRKRLESARRDGQLGEDLIENVPWYGYRLAPDKAQVRMVKDV